MKRPAPRRPPVACPLWIAAVALGAAISEADTMSWYERSFYLLHEDHHTSDRWEVGRDADPAESARLIALSKPDVIQIHAKGNPGWTTYPTTIGHAPPKLARDVLGVWRDIARRHDYCFSVYYNIGRDGVIMSRLPAWNRAQADGSPYDRALCYHSGVAEEYLWPMIREIMQGYKPDGFWFDGSCFTVHVCYCDKCRQRFRREQALEAPRSPAAPGWHEYKEMQRQVYREFVHDTAVMIHEIDPKCLVAVNWAYSLRMPERPDPELAYLTGDIGNNVDALSGEAHWYDSLGVPFDLMTQVKTRYGKAMRPKPPEQIEQEIAVIIANGGRYFAWDNPTPESGLVPETMAFLGEVVGPFLRRRQQWCLGSQRLPDVSLLHHAAAHYAVTDTSTVCFSKNDNRIDGACDGLRRLHLNYEMIPDWRLREQDIRSPLLIVEHPKTLTEQAVDALIKFVQDGGRLLMTGMGITHDARLLELAGIGELVGPTGSELLSVRLADGITPFQHWLFRLTLSTATQLLAVQDAEGDTHPILTRNEFGRGLAFYVPLPLLSRHGLDVVPAELRRLVFDAALPPENRLVNTSAPDTVEVVLRRKGDLYILHLVNRALGDREVTKAGTRRYTKITDVPTAPRTAISIRLPTKPKAVTLKPQGTALERWAFSNGRLEAVIPGFAVHQMVVMRVR